ncbi:MAG: adenosine nucleotide hydrolase [Bacillaceae bacterium G1]|nr:MAG: adenosine nucleotide hydrolase [Bacillaceae bacterium G1]
MTIAHQPFFSSWSGGKDSTLALYHALRNHGKPRFLFTMFEEDGSHSRAHRLPKQLLEKQAESLNIPLVTRSASWEAYENVFVDQLRRFKEQGVQVGVFGDIDLQGHVIWQEKVCAAAGMTAYIPLWKRPRRELAYEFVYLGFQAVIVAVNRQMIDERYLGRPYNKETLADMERDGIDVTGESGEFHTFVTDGPIFRNPIEVRFGKMIADENYCFVDWS